MGPSTDRRQPTERLQEIPIDPWVERPASDKRERPLLSRETDGSKPVRMSHRAAAKGQLDSRGVTGTTPRSTPPSKPPRLFVGRPPGQGGAREGTNLSMDKAPTHREPLTRRSISLPETNPLEGSPICQSPLRKSTAGEGRARTSLASTRKQSTPCSQSFSQSQLSGRKIPGAVVGAGAGAGAEDRAKAGAGAGTTAVAGALDTVEEQAKAPFGLSIARLYQLKSLKERMNRSPPQKRSPPTPGRKTSG